MSNLTNKITINPTTTTGTELTWTYDPARVLSTPSTVEEWFKAIFVPDHDKRLTPTRITRNGPATIIFWKDGTKTVVKRSNDDPDDLYSAVASAIAIKLFGSNSHFKRVIKNAVKDSKKG